MGVAAASTIYAVLHGFTRPLPVPDGGRVVQIQLHGERGGRALAPSADALTTWAHAPALTAVGAFDVLSVRIETHGGSPSRIDAAELSPGVLRLLDVAPVLGRLPRAVRDEEPAEVAVTSRLAHVLFGAGAPVLGQPLRIAGRPATVVGTLPDSFGFPYRQSLWWVSSELGRRSASAGSEEAANLELVGRLARGATFSAASGQLTTALDHVRAARDPGAEPVRVVVSGFTRDRGEAGEVVALMALLGLVLLLVLVSTTNVANLLLTRANERARLLTVHAALGAAPGQIALQLLGEAAVLSLAGAVLGLAAGGVAVGFIQRSLAGNWGYFWMRVAVDRSVVAFTLGLAVVLALVSGAAPALAARRRDLSTALRASTPGSGRHRQAGSVALLTAQVAFSTSALVLALIMSIGVVTLARSGAALPRDQMVMGSVSLDSASYPTSVDRGDLRRRLLAALGRVGARDAMLTTGVPGFRAEAATLDVEGSQPRTEPEARGVGVFGVTPAFFDAFGMSPAEGRLLRDGDAAPSEPAAVLSVDLAREAFPSGRVLGRRIRLGRKGVAGPWYRVVGVAAGPYRDDQPRMWAYVPIETRDPKTFFVALRADRGGGLALAPALRRAIHSVDPELSLDESMVGTPVYTLGRILDYVGRFYRTTGLLSVLGAVGAVLVALFGVYGVLALDLRRRVREMGIRMAMGASPGSVAGRVFRLGLVRVAPGVAIGLFLAWLAAPVFGLFAGPANPRDPRLLLVAAAGYLFAALLAAAPTALRTARVDPATVLRDEG
jgi:predicted permease